VLRAKAYHITSSLPFAPIAPPKRRPRSGLSTPTRGSGAGSFGGLPPLNPLRSAGSAEAAAQREARSSSGAGSLGGSVLRPRASSGAGLWPWGRTGSGRGRRDEVELPGRTSGTGAQQAPEQQQAAAQQQGTGQQQAAGQQQAGVQAPMDQPLQQQPAQDEEDEEDPGQQRPAWWRLNRGGSKPKRSARRQGRSQ
jgi:hypothetical protein